LESGDNSPVEHEPLLKNFEFLVFRYYFEIIVNDDFLRQGQNEVTSKLKFIVCRSPIFSSVGIFYNISYLITEARNRIKKRYDSPKKYEQKYQTKRDQ